MHGVFVKMACTILCTLASSGIGTTEFTQNSCTQMKRLVLWNSAQLFSSYISSLRLNLSTLTPRKYPTWISTLFYSDLSNKNCFDFLLATWRASPLSLKIPLFHTLSVKVYISTARYYFKRYPFPCHKHQTENETLVLLRRRKHPSRPFLLLLRKNKIVTRLHQERLWIDRL